MTFQEANVELKVIYGEDYNGLLIEKDEKLVILLLCHGRYETMEYQEYIRESKITQIMEKVAQTYNLGL